MSNPGVYYPYNSQYYYPPAPPTTTSQQYSPDSYHPKSTVEKPHPPVEPDDMELDSPTNESEHPIPPPAAESYSQSYQQGQNQYDQSYQQGQNQYGQSYQQGQNQYDQSYQQGQNQYDQSYQQGQNQYGQSYQQGQNQYGQSYQQGQNQYGQSYQQGQNQSYQQGQNQYDQSYQQGQNQSYQQGQNQSYQSYQQEQNQSYQSYQQGQNQSYQSYQQGQQNQSYQSGGYQYYQTQYYTPNYYSGITGTTGTGGTGYWNNGQWGQWQPTYTTPIAEVVRGGVWPQWTPQKRRGRGRGRGMRQVGQYSSVPPPSVGASKTNVTTPTTTTTSSRVATPIAASSVTTTPTSTTTTSESNTTTTNITSNDWPPGLQEYMVRSFASCQSDDEKTQVEQYLKVEINEMFRDKRVWQIDWSTEPLPLEKFKRQAQKRKSRWDTPSPSSSPASSTADQPQTTAPTLGLVQQQQQVVTGFGKKRKKSKRGKGKFFIDRIGGTVDTGDLTEEDKARVDLRSARFAKGVDGNRKFKAKLSIEELLKTVSVSETDSYCIEGTSTQLEKRYLRLTTAPDPSTVRAEPILHQSLKFVLEKSSTKEYNYICEQLKSIRQDLTIQGIRNEFTVEVYETHGRISLKHGDWSEFNQCQNQLSSLYNEGLSGHRAEFVAYRILYQMMTNETADFVGVFKGITSEMVSDPAVSHAMKLRKAWSFGNYKRFFQLYKATPNCGRHLVDLFIDRERRGALKIIAKAYRPSLLVEYVSSILSFSTVSECLTFLTSCEAVLDDTQQKIDCRLTYNKLTAKPS